MPRSAEPQENFLDQKIYTRKNMGMKDSLVSNLGGARSSLMKQLVYEKLNLHIDK